MDNHPYYNRTNFPRRVWHRPDANWDIYADAFGNCASIATKPSCRSTGFGNLAHVAKCKQRDAINRGAHDRRYEQRHKRWQAIEAGLHPMTGQQAYAIDCQRKPTYHDGRPRCPWEQLDPEVQANWNRYPTPREWKA